MILTKNTISCTLAMPATGFRDRQNGDTLAWQELQVPVTLALTQESSPYTSPP
ncbi:hypothetical protein [Microseira sp. BLCC-F43]|uniref:hypothetical protein n=1 Tax=Microseira sp. BLCC-F43 TaxID=3153602 RepID=UPI0035B99923